MKSRRRTGTLVRAAILILTAFVATLIVVPAEHVVASTHREHFASTRIAALPATDWLIKGQDLAPWNPGGDRPSIGIAAAASDNDLTLPAFKWILCGAWIGTVYGQSDYTSCTANSNSTLVFEDYNRFAAAIDNGLFKSLNMHYAMYDIESWAYTPVAQATDASYWIQRAITLANQNNIKLIVSPGGWVSSAINEEDVVTDGAYMVSVQSQGWGWDTTTKTWHIGIFDKGLKSVVAELRKARAKARTKTIVMIGLGTNTPRVHPVPALRKEFDYAQRIGVSYIWINSNNWERRSQCTAAEGGYGCSVIGAEFLAAP